ncbi:MAG TPA: response regulator [Thermoanaerobaculia bacterium]|nr:response regulator [Thermoanaerobaculia bacterium]
MNRILLIDDDEVICGSLRHYLTTRGLTADVALDAESAALRLAANDYAVIIVDPYLTGGSRRDQRELLEIICHLQPAAEIIVLTGYNSPELERIAAECNVAALLTKPQSVVFLNQLICSRYSAREASSKVNL